jgi:small-conductance mechanosensitive channel
MIHGYLNGVLLSEYSSDVFIDFLIAPSKVLLSENGEELTSLVEAQSLLAQLWDGFLFRLPGIAIGIAIMIAFIILASPLSRALVKPLTRTSTSPLLRSVFQRSISVLFVVFGIYIFLFLAGLTGFAIAVVSGTGVVGLILGFAFRDSGRLALGI